MNYIFPGGDFKEQADRIWTAETVSDLVRSARMAESLSGLCEAGTDLLNAGGALFSVLTEDGRMIAGQYGLGSEIQLPTLITGIFSETKAFAEGSQTVLEGDLDCRITGLNGTFKAERDVRSVLGVPVVHNGSGCMGTLYAFSPRPNAWSEESAGKLNIIASAIASEIGLFRLTSAQERGRRQLEDLFDNLNSLVLLSNADGTIRWANQMSRSFLGEAGPLVGQRIAELDIWKTHPETAIRVAEITKIAASGQTVQSDLVVIAEDGTATMLDAILKPVANENGEIHSIAFSGHDLTRHVAREKRRDIISSEMRHRTGNLFSVIQAIVSQSFVRKGDVSEIQRLLMGRIQALSRCHAALMSSNWMGASLLMLARDETAVFEHQVTFDGPEVMLKPSPAQTISLIVHELVTNAAKHGALSVSQGRVVVCWRQDDDRNVKFTWTESGGPAVSVPDRSGFGGTILRRLAAQEFGQEPVIDFREEGLIYQIEIPGRALASALP